MIDGLSGVSNAYNLAIGRAQWRRLASLRKQHGDFFIWDGLVPAPDRSATIIVVDVPTPPAAFSFLGQLHRDSVIVIPSSENPAFDFLKSKLKAYGTVGVEGGNAPHWLWWGGLRTHPPISGDQIKAPPLFLSRSSNDSGTDQARRSLTLLGHAHTISQTAPDTDTLAGCALIEFLAQTWDREHRPIFLVEPTASVHRSPILPQALDCDFAVFRRESGQLDAGVLYFAKTTAAREVIETWKTLATSYPFAPSSYLLDQAWALVSSQLPLETVWLPRSYCHTLNVAKPAEEIVIERGVPDDDIPPTCLPLEFRRSRRSRRPHAPECHFVLKGAEDGRGPITVAIRDVLTDNARNLRAAIQSVTSAFANEDGGFSQLELVLCVGTSDVKSVMAIRDNAPVLVIDATQRLSPDAFRGLAVAESSNIGPAELVSRVFADAPHAIPTGGIADAALARLLRSVPNNVSFARR